MSAFSGDVSDRRVTARYRIAASVVGVAMVILPLIYVGIVAFVAWYSWMCGLSMVEGSKPRALRIENPWFPPGLVFVGVILLFFLLKPLLARRARADTSRAVSRADEPLLHAFVERLCRAVKAPVPREIRVNCEANAHASASFIGENQSREGLVLTLGLPLAFALTAQELTGILAHEFGHFSQGAGMTMSTVIRSVSHWFDRVAQERDSWDVRLQTWSEKLPLQLSIFLILAQLCIVATRWVLRLLAVAGHGISGFLLRQMEFDADRVQVLVSGSAAFESTMTKVALLGACSHPCLEQLERSLREGRLVDDFPAHLVQFESRLPAEARRKILGALAMRSTGLFDTHPSTSERIERVRELALDGVFHSDAPAEVLFSNLKKLSRAATRDFYGGAFGPRFKESLLAPAAEFHEQESLDALADEAANRYYQAMPLPFRPILLAEDAAAAPADLRQAARGLQAARKRMVDLAAPYRIVAADHEALEAQVDEVSAALVMVRAGVRIKREGLGLPSVKEDDLARDLVALEKKRERPSDKSVAFEKAVTQRLGAALRLLFAPWALRHMDGAQEVREEVTRLLPASRVLETALPEVRALRLHARHLTMFVVIDAQKDRKVNLERAVAIQATQVINSLKALRAVLGAVPHPFRRAGEAQTLANVALGLAGLTGAAHCAREADESIERILYLRYRLLARLAHSAQRVEKALGLSPLPEPPTGTASVHWSLLFRV